MSLEIKLDQILKNYAEIEKELAGNLGDDPKKYAKLSKKFADLSELVSKINDFNKFKKELDDLDSLLESDDDEMKEFARQKAKDGMRMHRKEGALRIFKERNKKHLWAVKWKTYLSKNPDISQLEDEKRKKKKNKD